MIEAQAGAGKQHARAAKGFGKKTIVNTLAVGCVTNNRVSNMLEMAADLVATTG